MVTEEQEKLLKRLFVEGFTEYTDKSPTMRDGVILVVALEEFGVIIENELKKTHGNSEEIDTVKRFVKRELNTRPKEEKKE